MKFFQILIPAFLLATLLFSGCHTKFNAVESEYTSKTSHIEDGWFEIDNAFFYIDYSTRDWFSYYGIDLANDKNFLRMAYFNYHHPTSQYRYSPFRSSFFYNYPGYSNSYFQRTNWSFGGLYTSFHPPYYSNNPYMHSFYYNKWAHWAYWQTAFPSYWDSEIYNIVSVNPQGSSSRRSGVLSGNVNGGLQARDGRIHNRIDVEGSERLFLTSREQISAPDLDRVELNDKQRSLRDRHGADSIDRMVRQRSARSPLSSWSNWEQRNRSGSTSSARTKGITNRTVGSQSTGNTAVRGSSTNRGESGSTRTSGSNRSSGESSSSRGNN